MRIKMNLKSDVIFGNGMSVPGAEDISVLHDEYGFPYFKGSTFKGIFREELYNYLSWIGKSDTEADTVIQNLLGMSGDDHDGNKIVFSDFIIADNVKAAVMKEFGESNPDMVLDIFTNLRSFTSIGDNGIAKPGSLRMARCVNSGINFFAVISCEEKDEKLIKDVLGLIKWVGSMRNKGFGNVEVTVLKEDK